MTPATCPRNQGANVPAARPPRAASCDMRPVLLGGKPRHQLYAQLFGVLVGAAVVVPAFAILFPDPSVLGTEALPAPSCIVWKGVSEVVIDGVGKLPRSAQIAMVTGLLLGISLAILDKVARGTQAGCHRRRGSASRWSSPAATPSPCRCAAGPSGCADKHPKLGDATPCPSARASSQARASCSPMIAILSEDREPRI